MIAADNLDALDETPLRQTVRRLRVELQHKSALLDKLTHDVLERLPTQPASRIAQLLPHRWSASSET